MQSKPVFIFFDTGRYETALVGSHVEGGDRIISTPVHGTAIRLNSQDPLPKGFPVEGYLASPCSN